MARDEDSRWGGPTHTAPYLDWISEFIGVGGLTTEIIGISARGTFADIPGGAEFPFSAKDASIGPRYWRCRTHLFMILCPFGFRALRAA